MDSLLYQLQATHMSSNAITLESLNNYSSLFSILELQYAYVIVDER